jgi:DNA segregation ATPase FtsK/SpoIIIE, S-DNA-T family
LKKSLLCEDFFIFTFLNHIQVSTKKKNTTTSKQKKPKQSWLRFFKDERFKVSLGIMFISFAILLSLSFISYFFTWKQDQSKFNIENIELIKDADIQAENWIGKLGALLSDKFIHDWFGIASVGFIFLFILFGFRLLNIRLAPLSKSLFLTLVGMIWLSLLLGYLFSDRLFYLGGAHGYFLAQWFNALMGKAGTIVFILISFFAILIFSFKQFLETLKNWIFSVRQFKFKDLKESDSEDDDEVSDSEIAVSNSIGNTDSDEDEVSEEQEINIYEHETNLDENDSIEPIRKKIEEDNKEGYEFEFEKAEEDEKTPENQIKVSASGDYDPKLDLQFYKMPPLDLLEDHKSDVPEVSEADLKENSDKIIKTLQDYKIEISKISATIGPTVTLYEIVPAPGIRISKIKNLEDDIALSLAALGIRIIAPIPGKGTIGIEVPNRHPEIVSMRDVLMSKKFQECDYELPVVIGRKINNEPLVFNLAKMPHLLMAGATGQGKSVGLNAIITSLLYKKHPAQLKFVMVDPKKIELSFYSKLERHFLAKLPDEEEPIITDTQKVIHTLNSLTKEMDMRYDLLKKAGARNLIEYNKKYIKRKLNPEKGHHYLPYIVVVIDEFADLIQTAGREIEGPIARLAQLARAIGIHLIIATQRPSTNVITGTIKANFPSRISFRVSSSIDSRTILDSTGANQLIGRGDMLLNDGKQLVRAQCAFVDTPEIEQITDYIANQQGYPSALLLPEPDTEESEGAKVMADEKLDDLFDEAARMVVRHQQGSTSLIQRKLAIGYNRAGRIIDQLEARNIVGPFEGSKARKVLFPDEYSLEQYLTSLHENEN